MNELQIFTNSEFGEIRTITEDGKTLFCGKDVAAALGYSDPQKAIARHCKGGTKRPLPTNGGEQEAVFIPEGDIYRFRGEIDDTGKRTKKRTPSGVLFLLLCGAVSRVRNGVVPLHGFGDCPIDKAVHGLAAGFGVGLDFGLIALWHTN